MTMFAFAKAVNGGTINEFETPRKTALADLLGQGWSPMDAKAFVDAHFTEHATHRGTPLWDTADAAAQAIGGAYAYEGNCFDGPVHAHTNWRNKRCTRAGRPGCGRDGCRLVGYSLSVAWPPDPDTGEESFGGVGGHVRAWIDRESGEIQGWY